MAHSTVIQNTCTPGTPKTAPVTQESLLSTVSVAVSPPNKPSTGCSDRQARYPTDMPCPQRGNKRAALHAHKPMLRLPSPPYSLGHSPLIFSDAPDMGFIPLNWALELCHQQPCANILLSVTTLRTTSHFLRNCDVLYSGSSQVTSHRSTNENKPALIFFLNNRGISRFFLFRYHQHTLAEENRKTSSEDAFGFQSFCTKISADDQCFRDPQAILSAFCHSLRPNAIITCFERSLGSKKKALLQSHFCSICVVLKTFYNKVIGSKIFASNSIGELRIWVFMSFLCTW